MISSHQLVEATLVPIPTGKLAEEMIRPSLAQLELAGLRDCALQHLLDSDGQAVA